MTAKVARTTKFTGREFFSFAIVGCVGFLIDLGITGLVFQQTHNSVFSRFLGFGAAVFLTFWANSRYTFRVGISVRTAKIYLLSQVGGMLINFTVYQLLVSLLAQAEWKVVVGVSVGSALALAWNFSSSNHLLRKRI